MKLLTSGWALAIVAALLNICTTAGLIYLQREALFAAAAQGQQQQQQQALRKPRFWSFRADDVDDLITELKSERGKLLKRQGELDKVAAHIESEKQELEKTRSDIAAMRDEISAEIPQVQDAERKNLKTLSQTYADMTPTAAVAIFRQMDESMCVKLLSLMKPDKVGAILEEMSVQDKDESMTKRAARISDKLRLVRAEQKPQS
jgi:flagellar motility protein MotE (MotC chaperone)